MERAKVNGRDGQVGGKVETRTSANEEESELVGIWDLKAMAYV